MQTESILKQLGWERRHLWAPGNPGVDPDILRGAAVAIAKECAPLKQGDKLFELVTEGRTDWPRYSACGDLCHFVLWALGVREERIVNRSHDGGRTPWRIGKNISMLVYRTGSAWVRNQHLNTPAAGDLLYVANTPERQKELRSAGRSNWSGEHVCVLDSVSNIINEGYKAHTFDYGQVTAGVPSGTYCTRTMSIYPHRTMIGSRQLLGWVSLPLMNYEESAWVPKSFVGGVVDDNPYYDYIQIEPGKLP